MMPTVNFTSNSLEDFVIYNVKAEIRITQALPMWAVGVEFKLVPAVQDELSF